MRAFIAIELPDSVKDALSALTDRLRATGARVSWVKPDAMHLTLRFLGDLDQTQVDALSSFLAEGYAEVRAFTLKAAGLGAFPNLRRPNVIWVGVGPLEGGLGAAQAVAERAARAVGVAPETKAFHPHLTVARIKDPAQGRLFEPLLPIEGAFDAGAFVVEGVTLFSSRLTPQGPIHEPVQEYRFS